MRIDSEECMEVSENCLIIIGTMLSLEKISPSHKACEALVYYCNMKEHVENIPFSKKYEIVIDFKNEETFTIMVDMLNQLMKYDCSLRVNIWDTKKLNQPQMESCINLLRKLERNNLIELETIKNPKEKDDAEVIKTLENVCFFIGPGNTGKTSIISTLSELFEKNSKRVALLDLTNEQKLANYYIDHRVLSGSYMSYRKSEVNAPVDLYVYTYSAVYEESFTENLTKTIKSLCKDYDHVLVNTDEQVLKRGVELFRIPENFFVVHDCMLNKIDRTHGILLKLNQAGINMEKVSMIYNKIAKKACDIGKMEEKLVFMKDSNDHLIPLIDIHCKTLEIFYNEKTMAALNKRIMIKAPAINVVSKNYITNIDKLYQCINNSADCEYSDLQFCEFVKYHAGIVLKYYFFPRFNSDFYLRIKSLRIKSVFSSMIRKASDTKKTFYKIAQAIIPKNKACGKTRLSIR